MASPPTSFNAGNVPPEVEATWKRIAKVFKARHLMPCHLKVENKRLDSSELYNIDDEFDKFEEPNDGSMPKEEWELKKAENKKTLETLTEIRDNNRDCFHSTKLDNSWGCDAFNLMLNLAARLENVSNEKKVTAEDICTVSIDSLYNPHQSNGTPLKSNRLDFGTCLSDDHLIHSRLEGCNLPNDACGANHTVVKAEYLRFTPKDWQRH